MSAGALINNRFLPRAQPPGAGGDAFWERIGNDVSLVDNGNTVIIGADAPVGSEKLRVVGNVLVELDDDAASALLVEQGTDAYLDITTTNGSESVAFGNAATNPGYTFLGSGEVTIDGDALTLTEQAGDPGATANAGKIYAKDDATVTQLFYQASDGAVTQLTPPTGGAATQLNEPHTATEAIAAGAPTNIVNEGGSPVIREADANDAARQRVLGLAAAAIADLAIGNVVTGGPVDVPDAQWDVLPTVANVGSAVFLSVIVGNLTITAPSGVVAIVEVGTITRGGTGAVRVSVNVKLPIQSII